MEEIKLSIHLLDIPKFIKLRDDNEYLENFIEEFDGGWRVQEKDTQEIQRILNKNNIRHTFKWT